MKLAILIVMVALFILASGFENPALFFIGYLWTSVLYPTAFASIGLPLSMIFGVTCLAGYFFVDKSKRGPLPAVFFLAIVFAVWITLTTTGAELSEAAWAKWSWAIQSIIITIAAPLFLRTRAQIETAFIAALTALSAHAMTGGVKSILGTGGYDRLGRLMMDNFWLGETSTLAMACVITLPMGYYCINHSVIFEQYRGRLLRIGFALYAVLALMCVVGTSARTGVMALGTLLVFGIKGVFRKTAIIVCAAAIYIFAQPYLPGKSVDRFGSIGSYQQDSSATVRLAVWQWAISYAQQHPFGGGFSIFNTSNIEYQVSAPNGAITTGNREGTAPHSVYFEVLGEQGYPGLMLYLALMLSGLWGTLRISRSRGTESQWHVKFAHTLLICMTIFAVGASFVGIAFQPLLYLFLGFYCSVYRLVQAERANRPKFAAKPELFRRLPDESPA
jgi:probable O-glycosylation ligase (exosortase A-associated)